MTQHLIRIFSFLFLISFQLISAQNVMISNVGDPNEPSIMIDPKNPNNLVAGSNLNFYYTSSDGGLTWTSNTLTSNYGVWGDPVIAVDTASNFYFLHLSNPPSGTGNWIDRIVCQKSTDNGASWSNGSYFGLNGNKAQDKQWLVVDRTNNNMYVTWTQFDDYGSSNPLDSSNIMFSKSLDGGNTWSAALRINKHAGDCIDSDDTMEGAVPTVGPNGEIYVAWAGPNGIVFNRSMDQGNTWLAEEIFVDPMPTGWDYFIPGLMRCNGLPVTICDLSGGPNHGTIYINWSDKRNGNSNADIWLSKSTDGGNTWSPATRVNDDNSNRDQFMTWMDIDQTNGNLYFIFYDRRNYSDNRTDVYLARSSDGGITFGNKKISESPFIPNNGVFFGDYTNIVAHNDIIRPIWTRLNVTSLSIWTDVTPLSTILSNKTEGLELNQNEVEQYPNPASDMSYVSFKLHEMSVVDLYLYNQKGEIVYTVLKGKEIGYGKYIESVNLNKIKLSAGTYYYKITINGKSKTLNTVVVD